MKFGLIAVLAATGLLLPGCARDVTVMSAPNLNVYTSYTAKVPGKWALFVDASVLQKSVRTDGISCAAYSWPINLTEPFRQSVAATFRNLVDNVDLLDQAVSVQSLSNGGYTGLIRVNGDDLRVHLTLAEGFWSATAEVSSEIDAGIIVESSQGRLLGTQATGVGHGESGAGVACEGNAHAIESGSEAAMRSVVGQLAERFSNAPQIRNLGSPKQ